MWIKSFSTVDAISVVAILAAVCALLLRLV
jgi:hypothetical protein